MISSAPDQSAGASDLITLLSETTSPLLLLSAECHILAIGSAILRLLDASEQALLGQPFETIVLKSERKQVRQMLRQSVEDQARGTLRSTLLRKGLPLSVELEALPLPNDDLRRVVLVLHPYSRIERREQLILQLNRLVPELLAADSLKDALTRSAETLQNLGFGMAILLADNRQHALFMRQLTLSEESIAFVKRAGGPDLYALSMPSTLEPYASMMQTGTAVFLSDLTPTMRQLMSPLAVRVCQAGLRLLGVRGMIFAPLVASAQTRGVLSVWSSTLSQDDLPFIETFAHQIAAIIAQIELRQQMERQIHRLNSLATIAQAVTTIGPLHDVLQVICRQATELLKADLAAVLLPTEDRQSISFVMVDGSDVQDLIGMAMPIDHSLAGRVFQTGTGISVDDVQQDQRAYSAAAVAMGVRSSMYQPLYHKGAVLGVISIGHRQAGYFDQADMDFVARYAEYAAVAVANAQLHSALQQREREQQQQRLELAALLRVSEAVNRSLDMETVLGEGLNALEELGLARVGTIRLLNTEEGRLDRHAALNLPDDQPPLQTPLDAAQRRQLMSPSRFGAMDEQERATLLERLSQLQQTQLATVLLPLEIDNHLLGLLEAGRDSIQPYREAELKVLRAIASQLAQPVAKAQAHQERQLAAEAYAQLYRESEGVRSYLNTLIRYTPDLLLTIEPDMRVRPLNAQRLHEIAGYHLVEMLDQPFLRFIPQPLHARFMHHWEAVLRQEAQNFETEILRADGSSLSALLSAVLIPDYNQVFVILKDVTEQKQREAQSRQTEKLAALGRLIAGAAHEINNPLTVIMGLAELQLLDQHSPETRSDLGAMMAAAKRAHHIVQQLLTFARPQQTQPGPLDLGELVDETLSRLSQLMATSEIAVAREDLAALPPVLGDHHQIEQVLFNIMHNAVQSLLQQTARAPRQLSIRGTIERQLVCLSISDSGPGITPEHLPHIFEPFFTTRNVGQGTGLGLSMVHAIIQQHQGRVWAESVPGKETTFHIELPMAQLSEIPKAEEQRPRPASPDGVRILLVEDEDAVRAVIARALQLHGYTVDAVGDGGAGIECALTGSYALVISDLQMPGMSGPSFYQQLQRQRPDLRWLILTGDTMGEQSHSFLEQTGLPVLAKPFSADALLQRVGALIATGA